MNIQLLLSAAQGQNGSSAPLSSSSRGGESQQTFSNSLLQAFGANSTQLPAENASTLSTQSQAGTSASLDEQGSAALLSRLAELTETLDPSQETANTPLASLAKLASAVAEVAQEQGQPLENIDLTELADTLELMVDQDSTSPIEAQGLPAAIAQAIDQNAAIVNNPAPTQPLPVESADALATLVAQLLPANQLTPGVIEDVAPEITAETGQDLASGAPLLSSESSAPLSEIAARLSLFASYAEVPAQAAAVPTDQRLNTSSQQSPTVANTLSSLIGGNGQGDNRYIELLKQLASAQSATPADTSAETSLATSPRAGQFGAPLELANSSTRMSSEAFAAALNAAESDKGSAGRGGEPLAAPSTATMSPVAASGTPGTSTATPTAAALNTPVSSPAWSSQLGQQLVQFAQRGGEQHIKMQLHPAELGPLSISLTVSEQGTQAHFLSAHSQVRQVLEQAIPQLRELLAEQGISLGETSVGEQSAGNEQALAQEGGQRGSITAGDTLDGDLLDATSSTLHGDGQALNLDGRVDLYA